MLFLHTGEYFDVPREVNTQEVRPICPRSPFMIVFCCTQDSSVVEIGLRWLLAETDLGRAHVLLDEPVDPPDQSAVPGNLSVHSG